MPLFHCDGPSELKNDHPEGLFAAVNFGGNPEANFKVLREIQPGTFNAVNIIRDV